MRIRTDMLGLAVYQCPSCVIGEVWTIPEWQQNPKQWKCTGCERRYMAEGDIQTGCCGYTKAQIAPEAWNEGVDGEPPSARD